MPPVVPPSLLDPRRFQPLELAYNGAGRCALMISGERSRVVFTGQMLCRDSQSVISIPCQLLTGYSSRSTRLIFSCVGGIGLEPTNLCYVKAAL